MAATLVGCSCRRAGPPIHLYHGVAMSVMSSLVRETNICYFHGNLKTSGNLDFIEVIRHQYEWHGSDYHRDEDIYVVVQR